MLKNYQFDTMFQKRKKIEEHPLTQYLRKKVVIFASGEYAKKPRYLLQFGKILSSADALIGEKVSRRIILTKVN